MNKCKHCGCAISEDKWPVHLNGSHRGKHRCGAESDQPYGLEAAPEGAPCVYPCYAAPGGPLEYLA